MDRIEALDGLIKKLEDRLLKTQFELEITEDKLRRAEDELHHVEECMDLRPGHTQGGAGIKDEGEAS
jgi:hypothetical protein